MSDIKALIVPKWGLTMTEGTVTEWLVNEGDTIAIGDSVMDMETSKIVNVVESIVAGTLRRKIAQVGDTLPIAALLGVVADPQVSEAELDEFVANYVIDEAVSGAPGGMSETSAVSPGIAAVATDSTPRAAAVTSVQPADPAANPQPSLPAALTEGDDDNGVHATVHARKLASSLGINLGNVTATGRNSRVSVADIKAAVEAAGGSVPIVGPAERIAENSFFPEDDSVVPATSVARRLAKTLGVNLHQCRPTGRHGKVCKYDVEAANALLHGGPAPVAPTPEIAAETQPESYSVPMSGMRRTIASRMQAAKQEIPHFRVVMDARMDELLVMRKQINDSEPGVRISVNDCVIKAVAMALVKTPEINVQFDEASQSIQHFRDADISMAVAIDGGVITPIVKAANTRTMSQISEVSRDLATRAKAGTLLPEEFQGGTFTISNLGMFGVKQFDAIINTPQCAILAVSASERRPVVVGEELQVATVMTLSLSADHRVLDGAGASQFLQLVKRYLETPSLMLA